MALPPEVPLDGGPRISASFIFDIQMRLCAKAYTDSPPVSRDGKTRVHLVMLGEAKRQSERSEAIQRPAIATRFRGAT
jgi:hypothetical protein